MIPKPYKETGKIPSVAVAQELPPEAPSNEKISLENPGFGAEPQRLDANGKPIWNEENFQWFVAMCDTFDAYLADIDEKVSKPEKIEKFKQLKLW